MSFASPVFLWYFMPATLLAYWVLPRTWRNGIVAVASLLFYTWGAGPYAFLLLSAIAVNYAAGLVDRRRPVPPTGPGSAGRCSTRRSSGTSAILAIWKYAGFASQQIDALSSALGLGGTAIIELALPIGISFFTFHHISYVVDVYRHSRRGAEEPGPVRHLHRDVPAARRRPDRPLPRDRRAARRHRRATGPTTSPPASRGSPGA